MPPPAGWDGEDQGSYTAPEDPAVRKALVGFFRRLPDGRVLWVGRGRHASDAEVRGIRNGSMVSLSSRIGTITLSAVVFHHLLLFTAPRQYGLDLA